MSEESPGYAVAREAFLQRVRENGNIVEPETVIARANVYRVNGTGHLMLRTSRFLPSRGIYFFGLTHHKFEQFAQLPHPVIAFILSDTGESVLVPAKWMWERRGMLSANSEQLKLEIDKELRLKTPKGTRRHINVAHFRDQFDILRSAGPITTPEAESKPVLAMHSNIQGMLLEIGNARGFQTFTPNKSPRFKSTTLGELSTVRSLPEFPGLNNEIIRQIDVIWLDKSFPMHAFEVELTTGIWTGLVRLGELKRLRTALHVITDTNERVFKRRISGDIFSEILERCHHATASEVQDLYECELRVADLRRRLSV